MTELIVVLLEQIGIDHHQRQWRLPAAARTPLLLELLVERAPVGNSGQSIHGRQDGGACE